MKFTLKKCFLHIKLVAVHRHRVFINCARCGIPFRGLLHDLSKFSPTEFIESVRFYQGDRSPIGVCRRTLGVSHAWLHHKGRNKHHPEYWYDPECETVPMMPYKYAVECVCDKLAATKTYAGKNYTAELPLLHWERYGSKTPCNPLTAKFIGTVFADIKELPEREVLNAEYMKRTYERICLGKENGAV